jgi:uncharacterized protein (UPF0276 family)
MKLAINYSSQAAALLFQNRIRLDRFKCPDWPDMIAEASALCRVTVHFDLKAGGRKLKNTDWGKIAHLIDQTQTPYVNLHLDPTIKDYPTIPVDTIDPAHREQISDTITKDVRCVVERFGAERVIIENVPYRGEQGKTLRPAVEPVLIRQVVADTGCGLLLDISHARIAAHYMGIDELDYMSQLPVDRLCELHFTGLHDLDGYLQDHLEILDTDWPVLDWVLERIKSGQWASPWLLAFEYGGVGEKFAWRSNPQVIEEQVPQLYERVKV